MQAQLKKLQYLMDLFMAAGERYYTECSPQGNYFTFTFHGHADVLEITSDAGLVLAYNHTENSIKHPVNVNDFDEVIDCLVWIMMELRPNLYPVIEELASPFFKIGRALRREREEV